MEKGDIVLIPFPFTDLKGRKNRPALILISSELDITVAFISTQTKWREVCDLILEPSEINGLKKESLLRLSKIATLDKALALGLLGRLDTLDLKKVNAGLVELFKL